MADRQYVTASMKKSIYVCGALILLAAILVQQACTLGAARYVAAEEITGIVTDVVTGKPVADAIVAIRFERNNTGHSGAQCFRSMAAKTDARGLFRFPAWKQEDTLANYAVGEFAVLKPGYEDREPPVYLRQMRRSIGNIPYSNTITFPKSEVRLRIRPYKAEPTPQARVLEIKRIVANFACRAYAEFDDHILLYAARQEIAAAPYANQRYDPSGMTPRHLTPTYMAWIDSMIDSKERSHVKTRK